MTEEEDEAVGDINIFLRHVIKLRRIYYAPKNELEPWPPKTRRKSSTRKFQKLQMDSTRKHGKHGIHVKRVKHGKNGKHGKHDLI